jgi:hypothetical protein
MKSKAMAILLALAVLLGVTGGPALAGDPKGGINVQWER